LFHHFCVLNPNFYWLSKHFVALLSMLAGQIPIFIIDKNHLTPQCLMPKNRSPFLPSLAVTSPCCLDAAGHHMELGIFFAFATRDAHAPNGHLACGIGLMEVSSPTYK
jgi:hypothetical protein